MKKTFFAIIVTFFITSHCTDAFSSEFRGLWVDAFGPGFLNSNQVAKLVQDCRRYNFNAVFVEVRPRGDAFYVPQPPNTDPRTTDIEAGYDALAEVIRQCHQGIPRIEVHCWVVAFFIWEWIQPPSQREHVINRHPEYLTKDSIGQKLVAKGYYLDPGHPDAMMSLYNMAKDIVSRYDIEGFHWDYLRYPVRDSGYNETALQRYKEEFGLKTNPQPSDPRYCEWRRRQVTDFLRWSTADLLEIKPNLAISVAVFSNYSDSLNHHFADWVEWNKEGILDLCIPMDFSRDNNRVFNPRADFALTNQGVRTIYVGQAAYMNPIENTLTQLQYCRAKGFGGTVLYSYRNPVALTGGRAGEDPLETNTQSAKVQVVVDNSEAETIGEWTRGSFGKYQGQDYFFRGGSNGQNYVQFKAKLPLAGLYEVEEWHCAGNNRAEDVPHLIMHAQGTNTMEVNQQRNGSRWNSLGTFYFDSIAQVRVTDGIRAGKMVTADAVRFVLISTNRTALASEASGSRRKALDWEAEQQTTSFSVLKEKHQQTWEPAPSPSWKTKPAKGILKGTIISQNTGRPIYNAVVSLNTSPIRTQRTEPHGSYAFFDTAPGTYEVAATTDGFGIAATNVQVPAGGIVTVDLTLRR